MAKRFSHFLLPRRTFCKIMQNTGKDNAKQGKTYNRITQIKGRDNGCRLSLAAGIASALCVAFYNVSGEEGRNVVSEVGKFADNGAAEAGQLWRCGQKDGLDAGEPPVDVRHLHFVLEICYCADSADNGCDALRPGEICRQSRVALHPDARLIGIEVPDGCDTFCDGLPAALLLVVTDGNDDLVEKPERPPDDVGMAESKGVERPRE